MSPRRGVARRSFARRRIRRVKTKWEHVTIPRRFKVLEFARVSELEWETEVLLELEVQIFDVLTNWGVPSDQWPYYVGFAKRIWERALKFQSETFLLEKQSVLNEYVLRGHTLGVLEAIQVHAEALALIKQGYLMPSAWAYTDTIGKIFVHEWGGYDNRLPAIWIQEPEGINGGGYDNRE